MRRFLILTLQGQNKELQRYAMYIYILLLLERRYATLLITVISLLVLLARRVKQTTVINVGPRVLYVKSFEMIQLRTNRYKYGPKCSIC